MGGNPVFRGTRVPVHHARRAGALVPRARARGTGGEVLASLHKPAPVPEQRLRLRG
jgi:hypothetical protein